VRKLIAGPGFIFIRDECIALCDEILAGGAPKVKVPTLDEIPSERLLTQLKPVEQTLLGKGNQLQAVIETLRKREVSRAAIGEALGISRQSAWERFS
jgi:hypothetical protein